MRSMNGTGSRNEATRVRGGVATLAIAALVSLSACGSGGGAEGEATESQVVLAAPGGSYQRGMTECAYTKFEEQTGIEVVYQAGVNADNLAKVAAQKSNPSIDVLQDNTTSHNKGVADGLFERIDTEAVPNRETVAPNLHPADGYGITASGIVAGLEYNAAIFEEHGWSPPTSWMDLWDPKYKGHVAMAPISSQYMQAFVAVIAKLHGGSESNLDPAFDELSQLKPQLYGLLASPAQLDTAFQQGDAWIGVNNGARVLELKESGADVDFVRPEEGPIFIPVGFDIVKGGPNPTAAAKLLDFLLSKEAQSCFIGAASYGVVREDVEIPAGAEHFVPHGSDPSQYITIDWTALVAQLSDIAERWNQTLQG